MDATHWNIQGEHPHIADATCDPGGLIPLKFTLPLFLSETIIDHIY